MHITHHTELLNALIAKYNLKSYLEIGVQNPANNFDKVKCESKIGVDPETDHPQVFKNKSDVFFQTAIPGGGTGITFDLTFIDGLHTAEQVKKDFENSLRCLSDNGFIVIHDVLPENEAGTKVPRETKQWWGDVYKWAMQANIYGLKYTTFNIDNGCMVFTKKPKFYEMPSVECNWQNYLTYGRTLMNVTDEVII